MKFKRLIYGSLLSLSLFTTASLFSVVAATNGIQKVYTGKECLAAEFDKVTGATSYTAYIKGENDNSYQPIDSQLVRVTSDKVRVDAVGLKAGTYSLKFESNNSNSFIELTDIVVEADDRSGYAHFDPTEENKMISTGIGAYNNDGTLKTGAKVIYVTESTKNNVDEDGDGVGDGHNLAYYFANASASKPLDVRVIGTIGSPYLVAKNTTVTYLANKKYDVKVMNSSSAVLDSSIEEKTDGTKTEITSGGYGEYDDSYSLLEGLRSKITHGTTTYNSVKYKSYDSYFNMMDIADKENITVEGIGTDAKIDQWGFTWKRCKSIEVKNLTFENYPEDACSFESSETNVEKVNDFTYSNFWVHNNTFKRGKNNWDVSFEQDKHDGDGATDFKGLKNVTVSYNHYINNHKTGLVGGSDNHFQANFTFHHNYYDHCEARLPFARQANMHMYNNYYESTSGNNMQIYAGAYAFIESCYFESVDKTFIISNEYYKTNDTVTVANKTYYDKNNNIFPVEAGITIESSNVTIGGTKTELYERRIPAIKSYNNIFNNCDNYAGATTVTSRETTVTNDNFVSSTFDIDSTKFYYDSENKKSNVTIMNSASELPTLIPQVAGAAKFNEYTTYSVTGEEEVVPEPVYDNTSIATYLDEDFSVEKTITETNSIPTTAGIYKKTGNATDLNVSYNNNRLYIEDTNSSSTVYGYYIFANSFTTGKVVYSVDITTGTKVGSKWNLVSFLDGNKNIAIRSCGINSVNPNKWGYSVDGVNDNSGTEIASTLDVVKETNYRIVLTIDYDNNTAKVTITNMNLNTDNSVELTINDWTFAAIKGVQFNTANSAIDRSYYVNSISIEKVANLKLGYQLGSYTKNNTEYNALRIIGKFEYDSIYADLDSIDSITIDVIVEDANGNQTNSVSKEIENIYKSLKISNGTTIAEPGTNIRYYYTVVKGITSSYSGYKIKATSTINLKNGVKVECSGFTYEIQ